MNSTPPNQNSPFATLRQFIRERAPVEVCELCSLEVPVQHQHLIDPLKRKLICACDACAILFSGQQGSKYRRVPRRVRSLPDFRMTDAQWDNLMIPINMAFFFNSEADQKIVALYPSPAGPTESMLSLESWEEIVDENPILKEMEPDVEALLVNRVASARSSASADYYIVPIDECYKLVGLIRAHWRGLSGGTEVWEAIGQFFTQLKERSMPAREASRA
ncbi:MAG: DUF5947 family protein [Blastocatellia bacterium]